MISTAPSRSPEKKASKFAWTRSRSAALSTPRRVLLTPALVPAAAVPLPAAAAALGRVVRLLRLRVLDGVADLAVPERRLLGRAELVQLDVDVVHVRLRGVQVVLALAVLVVAVRVVAHLPVLAAPP